MYNVTKNLGIREKATSLQGKMFEKALASLNVGDVDNYFRYTKMENVAHAVWVIAYDTYWAHDPAALAWTKIRLLQQAKWRERHCRRHHL